MIYGQLAGLIWASRSVATVRTVASGAVTSAPQAKSPQEYGLFF